MRKITFVVVYMRIIGPYDSGERCGPWACFFLINTLSRYFSTSLYITSMFTFFNHSAKCHEKWVINRTVPKMYF
jgi:hypothetical protein